MTSSAIQVEDLGRRYGERWAVRHLHLEVAAGEIMGLLGPNGAGKTTTVKVLTGQLRPSEGRARVDGIDVVAHASQLGARIGVTFEQQNLYERLTVRDNLDFFARVRGIEPHRVREVLDEACLGDRGKDVVSTLSRGLRQRLMLARALLGHPRVLFLDEPTSGLDPEASRGVRAWIRRLSGDGVAVLLTTHDMQEAAELSARVAILNEGTLISVDTPRALIDRVHPPRLRVKLRRCGQEVEEALLPVSAQEAARELARLSEQGEVLEIREQTATLADVFLALTGRPLENGGVYDALR